MHTAYSPFVVAVVEPEVGRWVLPQGVVGDLCVAADVLDLPFVVCKCPYSQANCLIHW